MAETIGFIGLGNLARPIVANLLDAGHVLVVYNRTACKADALVARGAERAQRAADVVRLGGIVVTLLWDDASVESVVTADEFLARLGPGGVHVSMTTISPEGSRRLAALHAVHGSALVEAPVFGGPDAAAAKKLWLACSGPQQAKARVRPLLQAMGAQEIFDFGEQVGAATTVKLIGNFLNNSAAASLTEGLSLAQKSGVDIHALVDMLTTTLFPAPIYRTYGRAIAEGAETITPSPSNNRIPVKDLALFVGAARAVTSSTTIASLLLNLRSNPS
jgi:3-hydroxyisobutyrate dehydrogenase-like beta-hydroxyacid dehydrogenase